MGISRTGVNREWDIEIVNGSTTSTLRVARDENDVPIWQEENINRVQGQDVSYKSQQANYDTWHKGYGESFLHRDGVYHYGINVDARFPRQISLAGADSSQPITTVCTTTTATNYLGYNLAIDAAKDLYFTAMRNDSGTAKHFVGAIDSLATNPPYTDTAATFKTMSGTDKYWQAGSGDVISDIIEWGSCMYIGYSTADYIHQYDKSTGWIQSNALYGSYFAVFESDAGVVLARCWYDASTTKTHVAYTDVTTAATTSSNNIFAEANWIPATIATAYTIGKAGYAPTGMCAVGKTLFIAKTDGLYYLDQKGQSPKVIDVPSYAYNGSKVFASTTGMVFYTSLAGLYMYNPETGVVSNVTPGYAVSNKSVLTGLVTAITEFRGWLYASLESTSGYTYIMAGRFSEPEDNTNQPVIWIGSLGRLTTIVRDIKIETTTSSPRLWILGGTSVGGYYNVALWYLLLPKTGNNPLLDSTYIYESTGEIYFSYDDMKVKGSKWQLSGIAVDCSGVNANTYITVTVATDESTSYADPNGTTSGVIKTSGRTYIPVTASKLFSNISVKISFTRGATTTATPVVRSVTLFAEPRVERRTLLTTTVLCADDRLSRGGNPSRKTAMTTISELEACLTSAPCTLRDWWDGTNRSQTVLIQSVTEVMNKQKKRQPDPAEMMVEIKAVVL